MISIKNSLFKTRYFICFILAITLIFIGCGGNSGMTSSKRYGTASEENPNQTSQVSNTTQNTTHADTSSSAIDAINDSTDEDPDNAIQSKSSRNSYNYSPADSWDYHAQTDIDDSASAVDDEIWRQLDLAQEYHAMGVIANREGSWEEAQYYFEKGIKVLAVLDIESDSSETPESVQYTIILEDIVSDYRVTLRSLGHLEDDASASIILERFGNIENNLSSDTIIVYGKTEKEITYDLPIVLNDRVKKSIIYYQTVAREAFEKFLVRSQRYKNMMIEIIDNYGLPHDLIYLSMVESGYNPQAYSWARASGLWQFISSTGRLYNLDRDWWLDERRDPIKSTHAACQFLRDLYDQFGDWELAMAAYNGGPGRVKRTIESQNTVDFWKMKLKRQTMDYVPLIMAATIIAKDPLKYGFDDIEFEPEITWDLIEIDKCLELSVIAKTVGCNIDEIKNLNPELLRKYTPPNTKSYMLKIPKGTKDKFWAAYDGLPSPKETSWVRHDIRKGETISTIASRYGVSQYAILEANNLSQRSMIYAGKQLIVPVPMDRGYSSTGRSSKEYSAKNSIYSVRSGDTMWDIAKAFGTTVDALRGINYIEKGSRIYVGQKLKIPTNATNLGSSSYAEKSSDNSDNNVSSSIPSNSHKVRKGDTLWDIARQYGTTTSAIRKLNNLGPSSRIYPGQVLVVKSNGSGTNYVIHKVKRGESLGTIARKYQTTINSIINANNISNPDQLQVGEKIKIYRN
ncbi:MAG: LysM peptidoglycan-binding domain-containing protein [bacterium]